LLIISAKLHYQSVANFGCASVFITQSVKKVRVFSYLGQLLQVDFKIDEKFILSIGIINSISS